MSIAGSLRALHRYPVKSMAGEALTEVRVLADHGVQGDRVFAVMDRESGRVASGKHPRRWAGLLGHAARLVEAGPGDARRGRAEITLADGTNCNSADEDVDAVLSHALGRDVRLIDTPPPQAVYDEATPGVADGRGEPLAVGAGVGTFFDFAPIHLVTTASLDRLAQLRPASSFDVRRFRPNFVIDTGEASGFVENAWVGQVLAIGDEVRLCVTFPCPRCVMTTLAQGELTADPEVLRTVAANNRQVFALLAQKRPTVGVYATVLRGGTLRVGDVARLEGRAPLRQAAAFMRAVGRAVRR